MYNRNISKCDSTSLLQTSCILKFFRVHQKNPHFDKNPPSLKLPSATEILGFHDTFSQPSPETPPQKFQPPLHNNHKALNSQTLAAAANFKTPPLNNFYRKRHLKRQSLNGAPVHHIPLYNTSSFPSFPTNMALEVSKAVLWAQHHASHMILLAVFFLMSIIRNLEYTYHKAYLRLLLITYYPNKLPLVIRNDVTQLAKIPKRLSCIISMRSEDDENGGIEGAVSDISELAAWCLSAGIPSLTIYEETGAVKPNLGELERYIQKNLRAYFGVPTPAFTLRVPHSNTTVTLGDTSESQPALDIALLSRVDGKPTIVELTKTMSELTANHELSVKDITVQLIDEELNELVGPEPDLLICFDPVLDLHDYPPWHLRLSELYWDADNDSVNYPVFIRALRQFANCKMNVGK